MSEELQGVLCTLADDIRETDRRITGLQGFLVQVEEQPGCFSEQERLATRARIEEQLRERTRKVEVLRDKVEVYESRVLDLTQRLDVRKKILDENPGSLECAPDLMAVFVEEHSTLTRELGAAREFLLSTT